MNMNDIKNVLQSIVYLRYIVYICRHCVSMSRPLTKVFFRFHDVV